MKDQDFYYVPVKVEDGPLRDLVEKATAVLKLNDRLEKIFQNLNKTYNDTFKERVSVMALQVMNENYKPIFTAIMPSGLIRSPLCSTVNSKTNPNKQLRTPLKMKKRSFHPERKRLSFDDPEKENMEQPHETLQAYHNYQLLATNYEKKKSPRIRRTINEEKTSRNIIVKPAIFNYGEDTKFSDSPYMFMQERFNIDGKPETITSPSVYDSDTKGSLNESPDQHQNMANIADRKNSPLLSNEIGGKRDKSEEIRHPLFSSCKETEDFDSSGIPAQNMLCLEENAKTTSSFVNGDNNTHSLSTEYFNKHQTEVTRYDKNTPVKNNVFDTRSKNEEINPSLSLSGEKTKMNSETKTNEEDISCSELMHENVPTLSYEQKEYQSPETSSMSNEHKVALFATYTTPEKYKTMFSNANKGERPPFTTPIVIKNVVLKRDSNEQDILNPKIDMKTPDSSKPNKRKSVDDSDETFINGYLIGGNQDHVGPPKIAKLDNPLALSEKNNTDSFVMDGKVILNAHDNLTIHDKMLLNPVDSSTNTKISSNPVNFIKNDNFSSNSFNFVINNKISSIPVDSVINDQVSTNLDDDSIMDDKVSFNHVDILTMDEKVSCANVNSGIENVSSNPVNSVTNDRNSPNPAPDCTMEDEVSLNHVDDSTIEDKMPFNTVNSSTDKISSNPADSVINDEVSSNLDDDSTMNDAVSFSHVDDSTMNKKIFSSPDNSNINDNSFNHIDDCAMNDKISYRPDSSITDDKIPYSPSNTICDISVDDEISFIHDNTPNESFNRNDDKFNTDFHTTKSPNPAEKSERANKAAVHYETQNCCSPKSDQNITIAEDNLDISKSRKDKTRINGTVTDDTTDVESLTRQMEKLSPSVKRSVDGNTKTFKLFTDSVDHFCLQENVLKAEPPPKDCITPNVFSSKECTILITKMRKFGEKFHQGLSRFSLYHHLFCKDERDLRFVCAYLKIITNIVETIPLKVRVEKEAELEEFAYFFTNKTSKLLMKITLWKMEAENNIRVVNDCIKRLTDMTNEMEDMVEDEVQNITAKHLVKWESCMKVTNKKLDDMLLLRDIKRPTLLEFGYELENLIQFFIRCLFLVGIIKPTSKICSD